MAEIQYTYPTDPKKQAEGQSYMRSPLFDGVDYGYWKNRMSIHLKGIDMGLWRIISNGYTFEVGTTAVPLTPAQIKENDRLESLDARAMSILYCGLSKADYNSISSCKTAKQIWSRLEVTHEGTTEVKDSRIRMLTQLFENFSMDENESLDSLFARFADIVNPLLSLGKDLTEEAQVVKLLYALRGIDWIQKRQIVQATQNLKTMSFEALMGNLKAHEVQMKVDSNSSKKDNAIVEVKKQKEEKNIAFKAMRALLIDSSESTSEDDVNVVMKHLAKTLKKKEGKKEALKGKVAFIPRCFGCNRKGHMKNECPFLSKEKGKELGGEASDGKKGKAKFRRSFKRGMLAAFGASDADELSSSAGSGTDSDGFKNGTCFMAISENEVISTLSSSSDDETEYPFHVSGQGFNTLEEAHFFLQKVVEELTAQFIKVKKNAKQLVNDFEVEQREKDEMNIKLLEMKSVMDSYDSSLFDNMEIEFGKTKDALAMLELKHSSVTKELQECSLLNSLLNDELSCLNEKFVSLEKGKAIDYSLASVSPSCELSLLNDQLKSMKTENLQLKEIISKFTRSQASLNELIDGIGSNSNRHGLGYSKPKRSKRRGRFIPNPTTSYNNGSYKSVNHSKVVCHYCCRRGHISIDCYARMFPFKCVWEQKQCANIVGTVRRLPNVVPLAGTPSSSSA